LIIDLKDHPKRNEQVLTQRAADGAFFLFDLNRGEFYALNDVGERVWELSDGSRSVYDLIRVICKEFEAPADVVEADVVELLASLADEGLLENVGHVAQHSKAVV
jgi:hypothetical protein